MGKRRKAGKKGSKKQEVTRVRPQNVAPRMPLELQRYFEMAKSSRLHAGWTTQNASINSEIYWGLNAMRARSRDLWANNEHAKKWLELEKDNVIGPSGIALQMDVRDDRNRPDRTANDIIEREWKRWNKRGNFDVTGRLSGLEGQRLCLETCARDGENLIKLHAGPDVNPYGFAVQFVDVDRLDTFKNESQPERVVMGVGMSPLGRAENYHVLTSHPNGEPEAQPGLRHDIIPAEQCVHSYITYRAEQARGIPWAHAASIALYDLGGYREAAVIASRIGASKLAWWSSPTGDEAPYDGVDSSGNKVVDAEPGEFGQVADGVNLIEWDPQYPHDQFGSFNTAMLRGISGALGPAYHSLSSDLEGVSFSSGRMGRQAEQDHYMGVQSWMSEAYLDFIFAAWLQYALSTGRVPLAELGFERLNRPTWQGRRWAHIQPREEAAASAINFGLRKKSLTRMMREEGIDPDTEFEQIARDMERLRELGIEPTLPGNLQADSDVGDDANGAAAA